jgi:putative addiction module component (TIGR02574 family)
MIMDTQAEQILQSALQLPPDDRVHIVESLIISIHEEPDVDIDALWSEEIKRRLDEIDRGEVTMIPAEEVMREMRERLNG